MAVAISTPLPRRETPAPSRAQNRRMLLLIGLPLKLKFLLKDNLHLGATALAGFSALTGIAWYFKPLAGILSDSVPLWGTRRRSYLLLSSMFAAGLWAALAFTPQRYGPLLGIMAAINRRAIAWGVTFCDNDGNIWSEGSVIRDVISLSLPPRFS